MIELVSIEVANFRSFSHAMFAPLGLGQGLTAINGANGSGKSSIATHALLWALYGQTPDGVTVKALRRQESEGEVRATVVFRHDGQTVTVSRALRGRNDTTVASVSVDGVEQTNMSAKAATAWVTARLTVDAEAFTTAFVIRQKEVDGLVRARPAERRALIERLAGIDRMSDALTHAREQARARTSEAAAYGTVIDTARADTDAADLRADADRLTETARVTAEQAATAQEQARTLDETRQYAEDVQNALIAAEHTRQMTEQAYETAAKDAARTRAAATGADLLADAQAGAADTREARAEAEQIIKSVTDAENTARKLETLAEEASEEAARLTAIADGRTADEQAARARADAFPPDDAPAATALQTRLEDLTGRLGAATGERDRLDRAMTALRLATADGHAECPTCMTVLGDASALLTGMERDRDGLDVTVSDIQAEIAGTRTEIAGLQAEQVERARLVSSVDRAELTAQSACREALTAAGQATRAEEAAETAAETAHDAASAAQAAAGELPGLIDMEREAQAALRRAEAAAEAEAALPAVVQEAQVAEDAFSAAVTVHTSAVQAASLVDVLTARSEAVAARSAALLAVKTAGEAEQAAVLAARDARDAEQAAADAHEQAARRKRALADAETALAVSAALEEFRRDRIARLAPELSEVASDVVSTMTEGRYSTVELDEDFTPVLTEAASGLQRPTAWLSGGEESAVALALRIAIGEVVSGQRAGLLVLDEVLTAQDPARRAAVMSAIRALNARQVITINHVSEASDMVDLVAYVVPDPEGGSTLELAAGDSTEAGLVSEEMLDA